MGNTNRSRYFEIAGVLTRHGFGALADQASARESPGAGRMRAAIEELGPTFIKLGQVLSTRPDLVPLTYVRELEKLQEQASPFSFPEVKQTIEEELGETPERLFAAFDPHPIAAGSLGQAHRATLPGGAALVVKVQRPGIGRKIGADLDILEQLAGKLPRSFAQPAAIQFDRVLPELRRALEGEQDYSREASHLERFGTQFRDVPWVVTPRVHREYCSQRVLTMDFIEGIKPNDTAALEAGDYDRHEIVQRSAELLVRQIFEHGFFHGDPHPGNLRVLPGNTLCWLDYGLMGELPEKERQDYAELFLAFGAGHRSRVVKTLLRIAKAGRPTDVEWLEQQVGDLIDRSLPKGSPVELGKLFQRFFTILSNHNLRIPPGLFLMLKAVSTVDSLGRALDPAFDFFGYAERSLRNQSAGAAVIERLAGVPEEVHGVLSRLRDGSFSVRVEPKRWAPLVQPLVHAQQRSATRIAGAILAGCATIALAVLALSGRGIIPAVVTACVVGLFGLLLLVLKK